MVRSGRHKLIVSGSDPDLLFDLHSDPRELENLAGSSPALEAELHAALDAELDLADIERRVRVSQRERRVVSDALRRGRYTPWDHQPPVDAATQYIRSRADLYELQRRARLDEPGATEQ
jgi:choline-sulfatase